MGYSSSGCRKNYNNGPIVGDQDERSGGNYSGIGYPGKKPGYRSQKSLETGFPVKVSQVPIKTTSGEEILVECKTFVPDKVICED